MKLIVGLGNPGKHYEKTRHNVGFMILDQFLKDFETTRLTVWTDNGKLKCYVAEIEWQRQNQNQNNSEKIILSKPKTFMNNSGMAVKMLSDYYKIAPEDIWVIHDDVDFPVGSMRIRFGGASAGHRGVMSIITILGTDKFWRFRMGIGRPGEANHSGVEHYVLDTFSGQDHAKIREMLKHASKAIMAGLEHDLHYATNKFNTK